MARTRRGELSRGMVARLTEIGDPKRAKEQQAYMKSELPFAGVAAPQLKKLCRELYAEHPLASSEAWQRTVLELFDNPRFRELRYAAIELALYKPYRHWLTHEAWDMLDHMVVAGAWWDIIDALAPNHYAHLLATEPKTIKPRLRKYASDPNFWRRRAAILCQLKTKAATDEQLLFSSITKSLDHKEFFVRKAIGWALRAHARTNPDAVLAYVDQYAERMSPLSRREALKHLK